MRTYHGVLVGKSDLKDALDAGKNAEAARIFKETGTRYCQLYSHEDRMWFEYMSQISPEIRALRKQIEGGGKAQSLTPNQAELVSIT